MKKVDDFRLKIGDKQYVPIMQGGMGVDISTKELALSVAKNGGIGHISDAMAPYVSDRKFGTKFQNSKQKEFKEFSSSLDKSKVKWDYERVYKGTYNHIEDSMKSKEGEGALYVNTMEKLQMGDPQITLKARLDAQLDAGIEGITLSAGLHKSSLSLITEHKRFRDVKLGIIVSSARALQIFLRSGKKHDRLPDYVVVEGPLAGGHLGFGPDWKKYDLAVITAEVITFLKEKNLDIPVIPAGGIFTGSDAVKFLDLGASAVQVATRFTVAKECGYPDKVKQVLFSSKEEDIEVNYSSPTGYPMRMLKNSPSLHSNIKPNCEALGYLLDRSGNCSYHQAWDSAPVNEKGKKLPISEKMCICYHFMNYDCYTCGQNAYRLKDTSVELSDGSYFIPTAEHIFNDYRFSTENQINLPTVDNDPSLIQLSSSKKKMLNKAVNS